MPNFSNLINKGRANVAKFFNTTLPSASRSGVKFFNSTLVPTARKIHGVSKAITNEISTNENLSQKVREKAKKVSDFSDLGISRLQDVQGSVNRVASNLGLE